jgi:hypothetical protein
MFLYLPWENQKSRILNCKLHNDNYSLDTLKNIREWVINQDPSINTSTHWWYKDLPEDTKGLFGNITNNKKITEMFKNLFGSNCIVDVLHDMNEIYVSPPSNNNKNFKKNSSDNIFYTRHIDGPFFNIPFASCYRVIVGLDDNREIMTVFNMTNEQFIIKTGDVVGFDFHRECHYISPIIWYKETEAEKAEVRTNKKYRVILKIHYCVYPYWAIVFGFILGKLSIMYNKLFRDLFLFTLIPQCKYTKYLANLMIMSTKAYHDIEFYIGNNNIQYTILLQYISCNTHYAVFLFGSSFIHYIRWIDTAYQGSVVDNVFKRDFYFFKFLYMLQFMHMYLSYKIDGCDDSGDSRYCGGNDINDINDSSDSSDSVVLYTYIIVPLIFASYISKYTVCIPKLIEIYIVYDMLNNSNIKLKYMEYFYIYLNIFFNYIQLYKPMDM